MGVSTAIVIELLKAGAQGEVLMGALRRIDAATGRNIAASLEEMIAAGVPQERWTAALEKAEHDLHRAMQPRRLYERAPRTKEYGPYQPPHLYSSPEKARAYDWARAFIPGPPRQRPSSTAWLALVADVLSRDGYVCTYCGADGDRFVLHCDHIVPISRGGPDSLENLTTACESCNCAKRDALPHEWQPWEAPK